MITITVQNGIEAEESFLPDFELLISWAKVALSAECDQAEICIRLVDKIESQALNKQYRDQDKATNVLSFPSSMPGIYQSVLLGDLVLCAMIINDEAKTYHKIPQHHWAHMVIHGCLHLLGYDHIEDKMAKVMEAYEIQLLGQLGIGSPYLEENKNAI